MTQWINNIQQYINSKTTKNVRMQLYASTRAGTTSFLQRLNVTSEEGFEQFFIPGFACHIWISKSKWNDKPKQNLHAILILLDGSEPNEWLECSELISKSTVPVLVLMNKIDLCYRTPPTKAFVKSIFSEFSKRVDVVCLSLQDRQTDVCKSLQPFCEALDAN